MYKNAIGEPFNVGTSSLYQIAILFKLFTNTSFFLFHELYKDLPEETLSQKLIKLRKIKNLEREELAKILNIHFDTLENWELQGKYPKPENVLKLCEFYKLPLEYFGHNYNTYYNSPGEAIKKWRISNRLTYEAASKLLGLSYS